MAGSRRGATDLSGVLAIDKPAGLTSHDVVGLVRRVTGEKRIGHAGTLDPAATGVLVTLVGSATRLTPFLAAAEKSYLARITFGTRTDTDDAEGEPVATAPVPEHLAARDVAASAVSALAGVHEQVPPAYSAIKREGVVAHRAARAGTPIVLDARRIEILSAELIDVVTGPDGVQWDVALTVSKGTYVRSIARDLGESLGTLAHLAGLRRTASGTFTLSAAHPIDEVKAAGPGISALFTDPVPALGLPVRTVLPEEVPRILAGSGLPAADCTGVSQGDLVALTDDERLYAIYRCEADGSLRPSTVFAGGVSR